MSHASRSITFLILLGYITAMLLGQGAALLCVQGNGQKVVELSWTNASCGDADSVCPVPEAAGERSGYLAQSTECSEELLGEISPTVLSSRLIVPMPVPLASLLSQLLSDAPQPKWTASWQTLSSPHPELGSLRSVVLLI